MSGLELAAGILGVAQFTSEAITLSIKLKQLWAEVKGAPAEVGELLDEIEITSGLLEEHRQLVAGSGAGGRGCQARVLVQTQNALRNLGEAVEILHDELQASRKKSARRLLSSAKVVVRKPVLEQLRAKLARSLQLLQLVILIQLQ